MKLFLLTVSSLVSLTTSSYLKETAQKSASYGGLKDEQGDVSYGIEINTSLEFAMINYIPKTPEHKGVFLIKLSIKFGEDSSVPDPETNEPSGVSEVAKVIRLSSERALEKGKFYKVNYAKNLPKVFETFRLYIYFHEYKKSGEGPNKRLDVQIFLFAVKMIYSVSVKMVYKLPKFTLDIKEEQVDQIDEKEIVPVEEEEDIGNLPKEAFRVDNEKKKKASDLFLMLTFVGLISLLVAIGVFLQQNKKNSVVSDEVKLNSNEKTA